MPRGKGKETIRSVLGDFSKGTLHSGSKHGPTVKSRKQALAIALSEAGMSNKPKPKPKPKRKGRK